MWKLSDPVIKILSREVLCDTSILWIKDVIVKELIWDWAVVEAEQRERAMCCRAFVAKNKILWRIASVSCRNFCLLDWLI